MNRRIGTIRPKRWNPHLLNNDFELDDRSFTDVMGYLASFLKHINYYKLNDIDTPDGTWDELIQSDPILFMVGIINEPTHVFEDHIESKIISNFSVAEQKKLIKELNEWYKKIQHWGDVLNELKEEKPAYKIENAIRDILDFQKEPMDKYLSELEDEVIKDHSQNLGIEYDHPAKVTIRKSTDLEPVIHIFHKVVMHIQSSTREYLQKSFFNRKNHQPHHGLYITFGKLFQVVQEKMNELPHRHLRFYYEDVLQQKPEGYKPALVTVSFDLQQNVPYSQIDKGSPLTAGKILGSKQEVIFETQNPLVAHNVQLTELETLYFNSSPYVRIGTNSDLISQVYKNKLISKGKDVTANRDEWFVFGANKTSIQNTQVDSEKVGTIGFVLGSPVLFLSGGEREISLEMFFEEKEARSYLWAYLNQIKSNLGISLETAFGFVFEDAMRFSVSTAKGWLHVEDHEISFSKEKNSIQVTLKLESGAPALDVLKSETESYKWPSIKVEINEYAPIYIYSFLNKVDLLAIDIDVSVTGLKNLSIYNNLGKMPADKAFDLFGPIPDTTSYLMLGKPELFKKSLTSLNVSLNWTNIPDDFGGFDTYYNGYSEGITNESFKIGFSALSSNLWTPLSEPTNLFSTKNVITPDGYDSIQLEKSSLISFPGIKDLDLQLDFETKEPLEFKNTTASGFLKLSLVEPNFAFGNDIYLKDTEEIAYFNAKHKKSVPNPKKPYVPKVNDISISYTAADTLSFDLDEKQKNLGELYHIRPFWIDPAVIASKVKCYTLFPLYDQQAYIVLGLKGVKEEIVLSIFWHFLRSGSTHLIDRNQLSWEYSDNNRWMPIPDGNILNDGTNGLTKSGILEIQLPEARYPDNSGNYWLRIGTNSNAEHFPKIKGIFFNAVQAICVSDDPQVVGKNIPPGSIKSMAGKFPDIKAVQQPGTTYAGKVEESTEEFYGAVSERLRHKDRAVSRWDYEHLLLEEFDTVHVAKCTNLNKYNEIVPGQVTIIVLNKYWSNDERYYFKKSTLEYMTRFLEERTSSMAEIQVINPTVEYMKVNCEVEFDQRDNKGYLMNLLNDEINEFLSPFNNYEMETGGIGGSIVPSSVSSFISSLSYVKSVNDLRIEHIVRKRANSFVLDVHEGGHVIKTRSPWSVLSPVQKHHIYYKDPKANSTVAISTMEIGSDFILQKTDTIKKNEVADKPELILPNNAAFVFKNNN